MPIRTLIRYLLNNEKVIQQLTDSKPIREAAKFTAYLIQKGQYMGEKGLEQSKEKISSFKNTFQREIENGMKEFRDRTKEK